MSRNANSRFALNPTNLDMPRSKFPRHSDVVTSFNVGEVVPFYITEVIPGSTLNIKTNKVVRLQTLLAPVMSNIWLDTYYFFVPHRLVWDHFVNLMGENTESAWVPTTEYSAPQITPPDGGWNVGTIADYLGLPVGVDNISVSALPIRSYAKIIDDWFRDENLQDPLHIPSGEVTVQGVNSGNFVTDVAKGGKPFIAGKFRDYYTSALPSPQRGPDVSIQAVGGTYPVVGNGYALPLWAGDNTTVSGVSVPRVGHLAMYSDYTRLMGETTYQWKPGVEVGDTLAESNYISGNKAWGVPTLEQLGNPAYSGLVTMLGETSVATVNQLRMAFQMQKFYEKAARGGSRYISTLQTHFGVTSPDARLQRSEYLGGNRVPININQVIQTSATQSGTTPLGDTAAYSLTADSHSDFVKSFVEHGYVIGVMVARYDHSYQQGIDRLWSRKTIFDWYWPTFANIGEQAILNKEIYAQGTDEDDEVFGYQEAWAEYRYMPSRITGEMRSQYGQSLDVWHLADDYDTLPSLSDSWIREDKSNVDRVLAVQSSQANQLFANVYVQNYTTAPLPLYSIPGLIDHH